MKILIVDDQRFVREAIKGDFMRIDEAPSFTFYEADSGNQAIEILTAKHDVPNQPFDLIIADLKMENGDGLAIINHMAATDCHTVPLAIVSASDKRTLELISQISIGLKLNLLGAFQKPINVAEIFTLIKAEKHNVSLVKVEQTISANFTESNITELINEDNLFLCYQPKVDINTKEITGFEALSRLCVQGDGFIYPDLFIPLVEQAGLSCQLAKLVLNQAISQWELCPELKKYSLSINISASDLLSDEFVNYVIDNFANNEVSLILELTESQHTINQEQSLQAIAKLMINDISISLDDFGKSYSTFERLGSIPFNEIKIDRDFILDIDQDPQHHAIAESIIALANKLNVKVVAEGVETRGILHLLQKLGCDLAQGYYFSPPIEGRYLKSWLNNYNTLLEDGKAYVGH